MKWLIVPPRGQEIADRSCHSRREPVFSSDFNAPLSEPDGGVMVAPCDVETDQADLEALKAALNESENRIPYDQIRRELGLE